MDRSINRRSSRLCAVRRLEALTGANSFQAALEKPVPGYHPQGSVEGLRTERAVVFLAKNDVINSFRQQSVVLGKLFQGRALQVR